LQPAAASQQAASKLPRHILFVRLHSASLSELAPSSCKPNPKKRFMHAKLRLALPSKLKLACAEQKQKERKRKIANNQLKERHLQISSAIRKCDIKMCSAAGAFGHSYCAAANNALIGSMPQLWAWPNAPSSSYLWP